MREPDRVRKTMAAASVQRSINQYKSLHGQFPKTLDDLAKDGLGAEPPPKGCAYEYDAKTGTVQVVDAEGAGEAPAKKNP
jgi:hypothetical protein